MLFIDALDETTISFDVKRRWDSFGAKTFRFNSIEEFVIKLLINKSFVLCLMHTHARQLICETNVGIH